MTVAVVELSLFRSKTRDAKRVARTRNKVLKLRRIIFERQGREQGFAFIQRNN